MVIKVWDILDFHEDPNSNNEDVDLPWIEEYRDFVFRKIHWALWDISWDSVEQIYWEWFLWLRKTTTLFWNTQEWKVLKVSKSSDIENDIRTNQILSRWLPNRLYSPWDSRFVINKSESLQWVLQDLYDILYIPFEECSYIHMYGLSKTTYHITHDIWGRYQREEWRAIHEFVNELDRYNLWWELQEWVEFLESQPYHSFDLFEPRWNLVIARHQNGEVHLTLIDSFSHWFEVDFESASLAIQRWFLRAILEKRSAFTVDTMKRTILEWSEWREFWNWW